MRNKIFGYACILFFAVFTLIIFRPYFLEHTVPLNGNLLLSFFQPWSSYKLGGYSVGPPAKPLGFDALRIYYPTRKLVTDSFKSSKMPLWNPYQFSGNVLLGTLQAATFFPLGILFLFLPQIDAWSMIILLQPFFAACGMYLFLKQIIQDKRACFLGALTFGFSAFMLVAWWEEMFMAGYSVLLLPYLLYGIEKIFQKQETKSFLILFFAAAVSLSTGWFQMIFYSWLFSLCWITYKYIVTKNKKAVLISCTSFLLAVIVCAVFLIPSIEAFIYSSRQVADAKNDFTTYLMPWYHLISYVIPDLLGNPAYHNYFGNGFYHESILSIGIVGFIFALYALFSVEIKSSPKLFFVISWIVTLSLGLSLPTSWFLLYDLKLPLISTIQPSRIFFVSAFCASVLAAFGLKNYFTKPQKRAFILTTIIVSAMFIGALFFVLSAKRIMPIDIEREKVSLRNIILPGIFFVIICATIFTSFINKKLQTLSLYVFILITCFGSLYFTQKYLYFSQKSFIFPSVGILSELQKITGINRFLGVGDGYIDRNFAMYYGLYSPEGYESFNNKRYSELVYSSHTEGRYSQNMPRDDVLIMKSLSLQDALSNPYRKRMLSLLGVRFLVEKHGEKDYAKEFPQDPSIRLLWTDGTFNIYENKDALPRVFFSYAYILQKQNQKILDILYSPTINLAQTAILEQTPKLPLKKKGEGNIHIVSYTPEKIILQAKTTENGILVLSDSYYPGWTAFIDGKETAILRADYSLRAVSIPKGNHLISFSYTPKSLLYGLLLSSFGIVLIPVLSFII